MRFWKNFWALSIALLCSKPCVAADQPLRFYLKDLNNKQLSYYVENRTRDRFCEDKKTRQKEKEREVETKARVQQAQSEFIKYINQIIPLTDHGLLRLRAYPSPALHYAYKKLASCLCADNPFEYFIGICKKYCKEQMLVPDMGNYMKERAILKCRPDDKNFVDMEALREKYELPKELDGASLYDALYRKLFKKDSKNTMHSPGSLPSGHGGSAHRVWQPDVRLPDPKKDEEYYRAQLAEMERALGTAAFWAARECLLIGCRKVAEDPQTPAYLREGVCHLIERYGKKS